MKATKSATLITLSLALLGAVASAPALAELPKGAVNVKVMDTNKNGKVEKDEYLAFMAKEFDKTAGAKGYCTFEEVDRGIRLMPGHVILDAQG